MPFSLCIFNDHFNANAKTFYGKNVKYTSAGSDPMKVTGVESINVKEIYEKYYKHVNSNALCVPQAIDQYFIHEWNREINPDDKKFPQYKVHMCQNG